MELPCEWPSWPLEAGLFPRGPVSNLPRFGENGRRALRQAKGVEQDRPFNRPLDRGPAKLINAELPPQTLKRVHPLSSVGRCPEHHPSPTARNKIDAARGRGVGPGQCFFPQPGPVLRAGKPASSSRRRRMTRFHVQPPWPRRKHWAARSRRPVRPGDRARAPCRQDPVRPDHVVHRARPIAMAARFAPTAASGGPKGYLPNQRRTIFRRRPGSYEDRRRGDPLRPGAGGSSSSNTARGGDPAAKTRPTTAVAPRPSDPRHLAKRPTRSPDRPSAPATVWGQLLLRSFTPRPLRRLQAECSQ